MEFEIIGAQAQCSLSQRTPRQAWPRSSPKQRSTSTVKKPFYPSKEALLLKRKRAGAITNGCEAPKGGQTWTDPQGGAEKTESGPQKDEGTSGIA